MTSCCRSSWKSSRRYSFHLCATSLGSCRTVPSVALIHRAIGSFDDDAVWGRCKSLSGYIFCFSVTSLWSSTPDDRLLGTSFPTTPLWPWRIFSWSAYWLDCIALGLVSWAFVARKDVFISSIIQSDVQAALVSILGRCCSAISLIVVDRSRQLDSISSFSSGMFWTTAALKFSLISVVVWTLNLASCLSFWIHLRESWNCIMTGLWSEFSFFKRRLMMTKFCTSRVFYAYLPCRTRPHIPGRLTSHRAKHWMFILLISWTIISSFGTTYVRSIRQSWKVLNEHFSLILGSWSLDDGCGGPTIYVCCC